MKTTIFLFVMSMFFLAADGRAQAQKALVYKGPGACEEDCAEAAAQVAILAGFDPQFISETETSFVPFIDAKVWIQPGGQSSKASKAMAVELKENIRKFVSTGGGYVGFCAGGFIATKEIADRRVEGLGLISGSNALYANKDEAFLLNVTWQGKKKTLYYEGGPYFIPGPTSEIIATYEDGKVAALREKYGAGRVFVVGPHPEAPESWYKYFKLNDQDGLDHQTAADMIRWVVQ